MECHARPFLPLPVGAVVQVQNQKGKDPLRWDRSGVVVESLGNQQYTVKMDGSGRVSLRNLWFLRKIKPLVPRYSIIENVLVNNHEAGKDDVIEDVTEDQENECDIDVEEIHHRKSTRSKKAPDRNEARWIL